MTVSADVNGQAGGGGRGRSVGTHVALTGGPKDETSVHRQPACPLSSEDGALLPQCVLEGWDTLFTSSQRDSTGEGADRGPCSVAGAPDREENTERRGRVTRSPWLRAGGARLCTHGGVSGNPETAQQSSTWPGALHILVTISPGLDGVLPGTPSWRPSGRGCGRQQGECGPLPPRCWDPTVCSGDTETLGSAVGWGWGGRTTRLAASPGGQAGTQAHPLGLWDIYQRSALSEGGGRGQEGVQRVRRSPGRDPRWTRSSGRRRAGPPRIWGRCRWAESRPPTIQEASASSPSRRPSAEARKTASREVTGEGRLWCQAPQNPEPS